MKTRAIAQPTAPATGLHMLTFSVQAAKGRNLFASQATSKGMQQQDGQSGASASNAKTLLGAAARLSACRSGTPTFTA